MKTQRLIARAIKAAGGTQYALAEKCGCSQAAIWKLLKHGGTVSAALALRIEAGTNRAVTKEELAPHIFKPPVAAE